MIEAASYFKRQIELWGEELQESLKDKKIALIGCGGLGCSIGLALGASGIGEIDLVDFDRVSIHNIHRQIAFRLEDEGRFKAEVLKEFLSSRCSYPRIESYVLDFDNYAMLNKNLDLILDCSDNLLTRSKIDEFAKKAGIPWIYASVEEWHGHVCFFEKARFKDSFVISDRKPKGIAAPIVMLIASLSANLAIRYLLKYKIQKDVLHYLYFEADTFKLQRFNLPKE